MGLGVPRAPQLQIKGRCAKGGQRVVVSPLVFGLRRSDVNGVGGRRRVAALVHRVEGLEVNGAGKVLQRAAAPAGGRLGQVREPLRDVPLAALVLLVLDVLGVAVVHEDVGAGVLGEGRVAAQLRPVVLHEGALATGLREAGGVGLVGLLHVEFGQHVLPARLLGQLPHVVLVGVDQMKELEGVQGKKTLVL